MKADRRLGRGSAYPIYMSLPDLFTRLRRCMNLPCGTALPFVSVTQPQLLVLPLRTLQSRRQSQATEEVQSLDPFVCREL